VVRLLRTSPGADRGTDQWTAYRPGIPGWCTRVVATQFGREVNKGSKQAWPSQETATLHYFGLPISDRP